jgi:peptidoglycan/xylan/chitin deacetylase (PgdA/CDA1 family)
MIPSIRASRSKCVVLCYHRVAEGVDDPFRLSVSPDNFAAQLDELLRLTEPCTMDELDTPSRRPRSVVTFDDGYADNLWHALPIARAKGVPITVYVTSGKVDDNRGMWWDRMAAVLAARPASVSEVVLPLPSGELRLPLGEPRSRADLATLRTHLLPLTVPEIEAVLERVADAWSVSSAAPADARTVTSAELDELAAADVVTIGAHTVDHLRLRGQPPGEQARAVAASKAALQERLGRAVAHFAYPYGGHDAFDDTSVQAVREAGFATACTTVPGSAHSGTDALRVPRRIAADWSRLRFRAQMLRWGVA